MQSSAFGPKNAQYMSLKYISKFTEIMNDHTENLLLASLRSSYFTFFNDETQGIMSVEQMAVYGSFDGGLNRYLANTVPMLLWVCYDNHKLALSQISANTLENYTRNRHFFSVFVEVF